MYRWAKTAAVETTPAATTAMVPLRTIAVEALPMKMQWGCGQAIAMKLVATKAVAAVDVERNFAADDEVDAKVDPVVVLVDLPTAIAVASATQLAVAAAEPRRDAVESSRVC